MERRSFFKAALGGVAAAVGIAKIAPHIEAAEVSGVVFYGDSASAYRPLPSHTHQINWEQQYCESFVNETISNLRTRPVKEFMAWPHRVDTRSLLELAKQGESHCRAPLVTSPPSGATVMLPTRWGPDEVRAAVEYMEDRAPIITGGHGRLKWPRTVGPKPSGDLVDW